MLKSSGAMAVATMTSRILGMVREIVYASFMGTGWVASSFFLAFQIPNLFRRLLGEGALTAAFIPIFKEKEKTSTEEEMWRAANAVISGLLISASVICVVAMIGITVFMQYGYYPKDTELMLRLLRIMFPYMLLVTLTAVFMGMLNARGHFFVPACGSLVMNLVMILSVYLVAPRMGMTLDKQIFALAFGVLIAGVAQAAFQMPTLRKEGYRFHWVTPWKDETVRRVVRQMIPGTIGIAAFQINVLTTQSVAFFVDASIVSYFNYSVRLMELPQGVFGISLATYLLPTLSGLAAEKKYDDFRTTLRHGISHLLFVNLLATILLMTLSEPIMRLLFEHRKFGPLDTVESGYALLWLSPGLLAFSLVNVLGRAFYALGDTKTPMKISIFCLVMNLIFAVALVFHMKQGGLGLANTLSACINVSLLFYALRKKLGRLQMREVAKMLLPLAIAGIIAAAVAVKVHIKSEQMLGITGLIPRLSAVFAPMTAATICYLIVAMIFKLQPAMELTSLLTSRFSGASKKPASSS